MTAEDAVPEPESWMDDVNAPAEAEIGLLGAALIDRTGAAAKILFGIDVDDFSIPHAANCALAMLASMNGHPSPDPVEVASVLRERGEKNSIKFLLERLGDVPSAANAALYADRVRFFAKRRREDALRTRLAKAETRSTQDRAKADLDAYLAAEKEALVPPAPPEAEDFYLTASGPEPRAPEMIVERFMVRDSLNVFFGPPASGKSWLMMTLCIDAVTTGGSLLGSEELRIRLADDGRTDVVLWIYGSEDTSSRILRRLKKLHADGDSNHPLEPGRFLYQTPPDGVLLNTQDGWAWLNGLIGRYRPTILVLDTIASLTASTLDVNKAEQVVPFMQKLLMIRRINRLSIMAGHHTSKPSKDAGRSVVSKASSMLGSQAWLAMTEGCFMVDAKDGDTSDVRILCVKTKDVENPIPPIRACLDRDTGRFRMLEEDEAAPERDVVTKSAGKSGRPETFSADIVLALQKKLPDGPWWNFPDFGEKTLGISRASWFAKQEVILNELVERGCVVLANRLKWPEKPAATPPRPPTP